MDKSLSRNEFLVNLGRCGLLAGMAGLGVAALDGSRTPSECFNTEHCNACYASRGCTLPQKKELDNETRPA